MRNIIFQNVFAIILLNIVSCNFTQSEFIKINEWLKD